MNEYSTSQLEILLRDPEFADLYSAIGRPVAAPFRQKDLFQVWGELSR